MLIISKIPTNRQKNKTDWSQQIMYTYTLRKELSVELRRGAEKWERGNLGQ